MSKDDIEGKKTSKKKKSKSIQINLTNLLHVKQEWDKKFKLKKKT